MKLVYLQLNKAYETLRDATSRVAYDAKLPSQHRVPKSFTPQYTWNGFDGAWGAPPSTHWQPAGNYHSGQRTATNDYWGGTGPWHESQTYDSKDSGENRRPAKDQAWDFNNWHESQPSEPGSFSWTENEELWKQAEEERKKAEKERETRADAERRIIREWKRAERDKEQKRKNNARMPKQQKELSGKIIALDEEIARLSRRTALASEAGEGCRTDGEGTDTVDHFSIKLNRHRRVLSEAVTLHRNLCRVQRRNGQAEKAKDAEEELAIARAASGIRLAHEFAREDEEQRAGRASLHEERLPMQQQLYQSDQEKKLEPQEQYSWNNAASGNQKPNGSRGAGEHSDAEGRWSGERNVYGLNSKLQKQTDIGANPVPMQLRCRRIYDWLDQLVDDEEETEAPGEHTVTNTKHPDSRTQPTQSSRYSVDDNPEAPIPNQNSYSSPPQVFHSVYSENEPEPLIPDLNPHSSSSQASYNFANGEPNPPIPPANQNPSFPLDCLNPVDSKPGPLSPGPNSDPLESDNETFMSEYLQTVHKSHLEVHGEFWDFIADDEANCDFCGVIMPVLQCPKCNLRACSECKTHRGERSQHTSNMWKWR